MTHSRPVLNVHDVAKSFGPVQALRPGRLTVRRGSIHALVGENGAGKSTLIYRFNANNIDNFDF